MYFHAIGIFAALFSFSAAQADVSTYLVKFKPTPLNGIAPLDALTEGGFMVKKYFPEIGVYLTESQANTNSGDASLVRELMEKAPVEYIERDEPIWHATQVPDDELYPKQSILGQMNLETAWDTNIGSYDTVVAVIDTGASFDHPDLKDRFVPGHDFINDNDNPKDENGHGTHVAGIIGAGGNNHIGVTGVNWQVHLMPLRFLDKDGRGKTSQGVEAVLYAANHGVRVMSSSWGGSAPSGPLKDAIDYAFTKGTLMIAAAGNESSDTDSKPQYPSAFDSPGIISVAATRAESKLASFSNWGRTTVDVAAPGNQILSTYLNGAYKRLSGTSMATPMVSGMAALILSQAPGLTALELRNAIFNAVTQRTSLTGLISTEGEVNAAMAMQMLTASDFQVWPGHVTVKRGTTFQFSPIRAHGEVRWSVSDASLAAVDSSGTLTASAVGSVKVTATDASGNTTTTGTIQIVEPGQGSAPTPGCARIRRRVAAETPFEKSAEVFSMGLPLLVGFLMRRRSLKS